MPFLLSVIWPKTNSVPRLPQKIISNRHDSDSTKLEHLICILLESGITRRCDWLYFLPINCWLALHPRSHVPFTPLPTLTQLVHRGDRRERTEGKIQRHCPNAVESKFPALRLLGA